MANTEDTRPERSKMREDDDLATSSLELELAASVISSMVKRNGGSDAADVFWDEGVFESLEDESEYQDPELSDPNEETLPETKEIEWNLYPCN